MQDCSNSIAKALELLQSCTKPSILLAPETIDCHCKDAIFKIVILIHIMTISVGINRQDPGDLPADDQHWCHQIAGHYLSQWWPGTTALYGITNPQFVILVALKVLRNMLVGQFSLLANGYLNQDRMEKLLPYVGQVTNVCLVTWFCYHLKTFVCLTACSCEQWRKYTSSTSLVNGTDWFPFKGPVMQCVFQMFLCHDNVMFAALSVWGSHSREHIKM